MVLLAGTSIRGRGDIVERLERFKLEGETLADSRRIRPDEINSFDYVQDGLALTANWQVATR
jgi:hypothetical protein